MSVIRHHPIFKDRSVMKLRNFGAFEKILLIANESDIHVMKPFLEENFFDVHSASRVSEAMDQIMAHDFDAVVFDTSLQDYAFTTFYSVIEKIRPQLLTRFIFLVDSSTEEWLTEFLDRVDGLKVWRTIELRELFQMIEMVLGRSTAGVVGVMP